MPRTRRFSVFLCAALPLTLCLFACSKEQPQGGPAADELSPQITQEIQMRESALKDDPANKDLLVQLGNLYYDLGEDEVNRKGERAQPVEKWSRAIDYYQKALEKEPSNTNVRVDMANLMHSVGRADEAITEYRRVIKQDPKHEKARMNLILCLGQNKRDYKGALKEYDELVRLSPALKENPELTAEIEGFRQQMKEAKK